MGLYTESMAPVHESTDSVFNVGRSTLDGRTRLERKRVCFPGRTK
jgi:hypothetical protein